MATRILVLCKTSQMPGSPSDKIKLMADAACQKVWSRNFDSNPNRDRLSSHGGYYNPRCVLIIDHGPTDAIDYETIQLNWNGHKLYVSKHCTFPSANYYVVLMCLVLCTHTLKKSLQPDTSTIQLIGQYLSVFILGIQRLLLIYLDWAF
jgi:hypothetical protein